MNLFLIRIELFTALFLPGFLIAFLIGWVRRRQGKPTFLKIGLWSALAGILGVAILFGLMAALFFYSTRTVVTDHSDPPLTIVEARQLQCPIPLPNSVKNVRFAVACGGLQAQEILVRFEAPPIICRAHVRTLISGNLHPLTSVQPRVWMEMFDAGKTFWFDVQNIVHGEYAESGNRQCWIDDDRGIFYYNYCD